MVRTVFILLWDYKYRSGLSDDIAFQRSYTHKLLYQGCIVYLRYGLPRYVIFSIQYPYESLLIGSWVTLGLTCRLTMFPVGQRILSMVMVFSLKSITLPISCKVCLSINQVVQRCLSSYFVLHNVRGQFYRLDSRIFHRICQSHPPFCLKDAD